MKITIKKQSLGDLKPFSYLECTERKYLEAHFYTEGVYVIIYADLENMVINLDAFINNTCYTKNMTSYSTAITRAAVKNLATRFVKQLKGELKIK